MKLIKVHTSQLLGYAENIRTDYNDVVTIAVQSWYEKPVFWISTATAIASILSLIQQYHPTFAWVGLASGVLNVIVTLYKEIVTPQSIVTD